MSQAKPARKAKWFLLFIMGNLVLIAFVLAHAWHGRDAYREALAVTARMVDRLGITDLCLFTEARYTRHPSMADPATAFQDHPVSLEHFPTGSIIQPPAHLRTYGLD